MDTIDILEVENEQLKYQIDCQRKINNKLLYLYKKKIEENEKLKSLKKKDNGWRPSYLDSLFFS